MAWLDAILGGETTNSQDRLNRTEEVGLVGQGPGLFGQGA